MASMSGKKVCVITGANSGIGFETAKRMAKKGFEVILACRNVEKGNEAVKRLKRKIRSADVSFMTLNLANFKSIHEFVDNFNAAGKSLSVLVNNAGLQTELEGRDISFTDDGFELTFGVNHLGHFLLTTLLLENLKATAETHGEARVVVVSSGAHDPRTRAGKSGSARAHIDFDDLESIQCFTGDRAYKNSKLANILFAYELNRRLDGTGVTCSAMNPGLIPSTNFSRHQGFCARCCLLCCCASCGRCFGISRTVSQGAECVTYIASSDAVKGVGGKYYQDCREVRSSAESYVENIAARLWEESTTMIAMDTTLPDSDFGNGRDSLLPLRTL